jgi:hypothetical protein
MAEPANLPLKIRRGIKWGLIILCKDGATPPEPVDLTDWEVFALARPTLDSPNELDFEPAITDPTAGEITIELSSDQTEQFPLGEYIYDVVLQDDEGNKQDPILAGRLSVIDFTSREGPP